MVRALLTLAALAFCVSSSAGLMRSHLFPPTEPANTFAHSNGNSKSSNALFLTPLIEAGKLDEARRLSEVTNLPGNGPQVKSYSGFLTVNKTYNSNLFFWFFPAMSGKTDVPVLLWLQGGPGGSSLFGLFVEHGPFIVEQNLSVVLRKYTWNEQFAVLYIDNPVGTGFSFTDNDSGYARNENDVARDLYEGLVQFFTLYQEYRGNPFFVTGESYAGKYVPAISFKIYKAGDEAKKAGINLEGIAIGDGLCDPRNMGGYGEFLFQIGLIDEIQRDHFIESESKAIQYIDTKQFYKAFQVWDELLNGDLTNSSSYFFNATGLKFYFNILYDTEPEEFSYYVKYLGQKATREAIHVGNRPFNDGSTVEKHLVNDIMDSVKPWVEELLNAGFRTLIYSGQLDIIVAAPLSENFLQKLEWNGAAKYHKASRKIWVMPEGKTVAGYVRRADNLYQVIIRNAGHILPFDQPRVGRDMITKFVNGFDF